MNEQKINVIERLKKHEEGMMELYKIYAEKFPDYKEFWTELVAEEQGHVDYINKIVLTAEKIDPARFDVHAIQTSIFHIKDHINMAQTEDITIEQALKTALTIETTPIESKYYEITRDYSDEIIKIFNIIKKDFKEHKEKIEKALENEQKAGESEV